MINKKYINYSVNIVFKYHMVCKQNKQKVSKYISETLKP